MKILYAINSLSGGGGEVFTAQLACAMARRPGNEVHFVTYAGILDEKGQSLKQELDKAGVIYHSANIRNNFLKFYLPFYYARILTLVKPNVVHSNLDQTDFFLSLGKKLTPHKNIRFVRTLHSIINAEKTFSRRAMKWLFSQFDSNIGCSDFVKSHYVYPDMREFIIPINNGIELKKGALPNSLRKELGIGEKELVFLQIGSLQKRFGKLPKAHDIVFKAFKELPDLKCKILFLGDNSNIKNDYPAGLYDDPRFLFLGQKTDVYPYIGTADILLAPSRFEGLPISTIEAVCQGLPLLCSDIEGFSSFRGDSTVICKAGDTEDLKEKIAYCGDNIDTLKENGRKNTARFREMFDMENVLEKYLIYYR